MKKVIKRIKDYKDSDKYSLFEVIILILISFIGGISCGFIIMYGRSSYYLKGDKNLDDVVRTYKDIKDNYYMGVDDSSLSNAAIDGMINSLEDKNSTYSDSNESDLLKRAIDGYYIDTGIVASNIDNKYFEVSLVNNDSRAEADGVKAGDRIVKIDGKSLVGVSTSFSNYIDFNCSDKIKFTIERGDKTFDITIKGKRVIIESVSSKVLNNNVGYIKIDRFALNTYKQFKSKLDGLESKNIHSLIIDVRDNPGGRIKASYDILSLFFERGTLLYKVKSRNTILNYRDNSIEKRSYPVVLLANESTASAAEVLVQTFKDSYKDERVVGAKTYGKSTIQQSTMLDNGTNLKFTTEEWLNKDGKSTNGIGIMPDIMVSNKDGEDLQLDEAIKILKEKDSN